VLNSWCILSTIDYLFHKLFEEKLWKSKKMPYYAFYILLNPIMQEKCDQDMNQWKKHKKEKKKKRDVARATNVALAGMEEHRACFWEWKFARATHVTMAGRAVLEPMFLKTRVRHGENRPALRDMAVWSKWMMTWQKPTGKERSCHHSDNFLLGEETEFCKSIKAHSLIS